MFHKQGLVLAALSLSTVLGGCAVTGGDVAPWGPDILAVTTSGKLIGFNHGLPGEVQTSNKISGMNGETAVAIQFRPGTPDLYALGSNGGVYTINTANGAATAKFKLSSALNGKNFDIAFTASGSQMRVASDAGQNLLVDMSNGSTAVDTSFEGGKGVVLGVAYTIDAQSHFYAINAATKEIDVVPQPSSGSLVTVGTFGGEKDQFDGFGGLDVIGNEAKGKAYAAMSTTDATSSKLYMVKLGSGSAKSQGTIGGGEKVRGLALVPTGQ